MDLRYFACAAFLGLAAPMDTQAGPVVLEEVAKIPNPDPAYYFGFRVAIDSNDIIATGTKFIEGPDPSDELDDIVETTAFLFTRGSDGKWKLISRLLTVQQSAYVEVPMAVAIKNGIAALTLGSQTPAVFERTASGWIRVPATGAVDSSTDVEIDSGSIFVSTGSGTFGGTLFRKNAQGVWAPVTTVWGPERTGDDEQSAGDVDISGNRLIVGGYNDDLARGEAHVFTGISGSYSRTALFTHPQDETLYFGAHVALEGNDALVSGSGPAPAAYLFHNQGGVWSSQPALRPVDAFTRGDLYAVDMVGGIVALGYPWDDVARGSVCIFQRDANGVFKQTATLVLTDQPDGYSHAFDVNISGRTVIVEATNSVYIFELPAVLTQPASIQDNFEDGNAADWMPIAGSNFSVVNSGGTRVYRQSSAIGGAGSVWGSDRTNQAIQADIKPVFFDGADRWFGLAVRKTDESNYYYVTVRGSNTVQLKKMVNGVFETLDSAALTVQLNRTYRVHLEAIGTAVRAYVDGQLLLQARDTSLRHGRAGLQMYKTRADHDNIVVTSEPRIDLFADDFQSGPPRQWTFEANGSWAVVTETDGQQRLQQSATVADARAITGVNVEDQIVEASARVTSFGTGAERWFGVMARYVDERNYYYVTVRNNNTISMRKLVNGSIVVLDTAPLNVTVGAWYKLRLEAVANGLRAYVNGKLLLEAMDADPIPRGRYGALMYKAAATYDDFSVSQP